MEYKRIRMTILSEALLGSGESKNGIVNNEILYDSDGYPMYSAKTLRGMMREAMETIEALDEKDNYKGLTVSMLGVGGSNETEGKLSIGNMYLETNLKEKLSRIEEKDRVSTITEIRYSTKLEEGVAKDASLRSARVVIPGVEFESIVRVKKTLEKNEEDLLGKSLKFIKRVGSKKSRGKGLVSFNIKKIDLKDVEKADSDSKTESENKPAEVKNQDILEREIAQRLNLGISDENSKFMLFEIDVEEPVKIGMSQSSYDYQETKHHLAGSMVRGALISSLKGKCEKEPETFKKILKEMKVTDFYPVFEYENEERYYSVPSPNIFRITKDTSKRKKLTEKDIENINEDTLEAYTSRTDGKVEVKIKEKVKGKIEEKIKYLNCLGRFKTIFDILNECPVECKDLSQCSRNELCVKKSDLIEEKDEKPYIKGLQKGAFCFMKDAELLQFDVKTGFKFHHSKSKEEENIYRYESIEKGQTFYGYLELSEELYGKIKEILKSENTLYIGGSRNSGYGRVKIKYKYDLEKNKKSPSEKDEANKSKTKDIYFISDTVLINENGEVSNGISGFDQGIKQQHSISQILISGYNSKWGGFMPSLYGIGKGSVIRLKAENEDADFGVNLLEDKIKWQAGYRSEDGLGRIIIDPEWLGVETIRPADKKVEISTGDFENEKNSDTKEDKEAPKDEQAISYKKKVLSDNEMNAYIDEKAAELKLQRLINEIVANEIPDDDKEHKIELVESDTSSSEIRNLIDEIDYILQSSEHTNKSYAIQRELEENGSLRRFSLAIKKARFFNGLKLLSFQNNAGIEMLSKDKDMKKKFESLKDDFAEDEIVLRAYREMLYYCQRIKVRSSKGVN